MSSFIEYGIVVICFAGLGCITFLAYLFIDFVIQDRRSRRGLNGYVTRSGRMIYHLPGSDGYVARNRERALDKYAEKIIQQRKKEKKMNTRDYTIATPYVEVTIKILDNNDTGMSEIIDVKDVKETIMFDYGYSMAHKVDGLDGGKIFLQDVFFDVMGSLNDRGPIIMEEHMKRKLYYKIKELVDKVAL